MLSNACWRAITQISCLLLFFEKSEIVNNVAPLLRVSVFKYLLLFIEPRNFLKSESVYGKPEATKIFSDGYLIKNLKELFKFHFCDEEDENGEEIVRKYGVKIIRAGKNVIKDIIVEDVEIKKNKIIKVYDLDDVLGDIIFQDDNYILIYEKDLFFGDCKFTILEMSDIEEIDDRMYLIETKYINLEKIFPNIVKMKIEEVLKKCFENKILVHFEYEKSYSEKYGIIEKFDNKKIILKEIDKMTGIFSAKSEIMIEDISFLFVRNCRILDN